MVQRGGLSRQKSPSQRTTHHTVCAVKHPEEANLRKPRYLRGCPGLGRNARGATTGAYWVPRVATKPSRATVLVVVPRGEYTPNTDPRALNGAMHAVEVGGGGSGCKGTHSSRTKRPGDQRPSLSRQQVQVHEPRPEEPESALPPPQSKTLPCVWHESDGNLITPQTKNVKLKKD